MEEFPYMLMTRGPWGGNRSRSAPVIPLFLSSWNDQIPYGDRDRLLPAGKWLPLFTHPRGDEATEKQRQLLVLDWFIRVYTPAWYGLLPSLSEYADALRSLPEIESQRVIEIAESAFNIAHQMNIEPHVWEAAKVSAGAAAKRALLASAGVAARNVTRANAQVTAKAAMRSVVRVTVRMKAAKDVSFQPIVEKLQESALDLLDRMLECGH